MKVLNATLLAVAVLSAAMASTAFADGGRRHGFRQFQHSKQFQHSRQFHHPRAFRHRHSHLGIFIGAPLVFSPWWYYPPIPPVAVQSPPVYIEQGQAAPSEPSAQSYWYYCPASESYYPYVDRCAEPWQRVAPHGPVSP